MDRLLLRPLEDVELLGARRSSPGKLLSANVVRYGPVPEPTLEELVASQTSDMGTGKSSSDAADR